MGAGMSWWFLQSNSENDIFILLMDDGPCWSYEIICQKKIPHSVAGSLWSVCQMDWEMEVKLKDADKGMWQNQ